MTPTAFGRNFLEGNMKLAFHADSALRIIPGTFSAEIMESVGPASIRARRKAPHYLRCAAHAAVLFLVTAGPTCGQAPASKEIIVFFRHGEKPPKGLGQLSCRGLNRALALPRVLIPKFGPPDYLFAPNPGRAKSDKGTLYNYIRPLATIEPTAIKIGKPVNTQFGFDQVDGLRRELLSSKYTSSLIYVCWEHVEIAKIIRKLISSAGSKASVPDWDAKDFDGVFLVNIDRHDGAATATFSRDSEGLSQIGDDCP